MVKIIGEQEDGLFKSRRSSAHHNQTVDQAEHCNGRAISEAEQAKFASATGNPASLNEYAGAPRKALTMSERMEDRLGMLMLKEALHDKRIPNPPKWRQATALTQARRAQLTKERRERVKSYAGEGIFTVPQVAQMERVVQTTIRADAFLMGVRLRASAIRVTPYQEDISARRERLHEMGGTMITKHAAAAELGVSEATVRRDIKIMRINWKGGNQ